MHYSATLLDLVRYENAVALHSLEFAAQNAMRYRLSATLFWTQANAFAPVRG